MSELYPIALIQDRYNGTYSGCAWLAIANASELICTNSTGAQFCPVGDNGPSDGDVEAAAFWMDPPAWIAVGSIPENAVEALKNDISISPARSRRLRIAFEDQTAT